MRAVLDGEFATRLSPRRTARKPLSMRLGARFLPSALVYSSISDRNLTLFPVGDMMASGTVPPAPPRDNPTAGC